jgi:release factor glutamine methyltransferase
MLARREQGEPLQYVVGRWGFRRLDLFVDRRVLIPRPETEVVVEEALAEARRLGATTAVDLGTGSGAIALSLAVEEVTLRVWATEASPDAVDVARANTAGLGRPGGRVTIVEGSWFEPLPGELRGALDLVVSNPPYIAAGEELPAEVADWEPAGALVAGPTGLEAIEQIAAEAPEWLTRPGTLVLEIAPHQADAAVGLAGSAGFTDVEVRPDLAGRDRVLVARI